MTAREIVFLVFPDFQILDLTGPLEVFSQAERHAPGRYRLRTLALEPGPVAASNGLAVLAEAATPFAGADTVIVAGGHGVDAALARPEHAAWISRAAGLSRRTASVCSGAFLLAESGLLDGRRATTHWSRTGLLASRYPNVSVEPDPIFVRDGAVSTSAGVTSGIDLALALVEEDHGAAAAREVARQLVVFVQRPGGQRQFSVQLRAQRPTRAPIRDLLAHIAEHPGADLSVPALAERVRLSERQFLRVFPAETGHSPAGYVEAARVEAACRLLETTDDGVDRIARVCGFGTTRTLQRSFQRLLSVAPQEYRSRFAATGAGSGVSMGPGPGEPMA
ncbi:GlxA family transcriptional regulator [Actinospica durhamensis]|uniref:GlxA family transcriptional regulator n=1 Tax=Actinospica durhamensis TaxID=1508375 RepID=A0A941EU52_9ACTN|nr:GlxA family transcriptional regulator [Actinospica durhamensis]MBR7836508.1 GlxA family transcriptional regulator [Actinospica durhamensis]